MAFPRKDELLNKLKVLQPITDNVDEPIYNMFMDVALDKIINDVSAFTNTPVEELPSQLDSAMMLKLSAWITDTGVFKSTDDRNSGAVTSITEGDTSISYGSPQVAMSALGGMSFLDDDFRIQLIRYRRLRG
ncbi:hypothetical protein OIT44_03785 [Weissella ceti]|uniref:Phage protein n=1 Tax=Weissella ceti TaxID=759620 RepID=A0ABT3E458_9LACO|nr:hypothetical protein [Weissella ceti]MCW0953194.1 hypothetical protein [Weissella ceti]QVK12712.1 hypothetical protein KHQ31_03550 [Weissella ceti]